MMQVLSVILPPFCPGGNKWIFHNGLVTFETCVPWFPQILKHAEPSIKVMQLLNHSVPSDDLRLMNNNLNIHLKGMVFVQYEVWWNGMLDASDEISCLVLIECQLLVSRDYLEYWLPYWSLEPTFNPHNRLLQQYGITHCYHCSFVKCYCNKEWRSMFAQLHSKFYHNDYLLQSYWNGNCAVEEIHSLAEITAILVMQL